MATDSDSDVRKAREGFEKAENDRKEEITRVLNKLKTIDEQAEKDGLPLLFYREKELEKEVETLKKERTRYFYFLVAVVLSVVVSLFVKHSSDAENLIRKLVKFVLDFLGNAK